jgi:prepilin-type N-terminal cleavage/methylation domain-containing protein
VNFSARGFALGFDAATVSRSHEPAFPRLRRAQREQEWCSDELEIATTPAPPRRARHGFTVIEMIIAIMVMSIGIMGLAGTARYVAMQMGNGSTQTVAATLATKAPTHSLLADAPRSSVETRRSVASPSRGRSPIAPRTKWVTEQVQYTTKSGPKTLNYLTVIQCPD